MPIAQPAERIVILVIVLPTFVQHLQEICLEMSCPLSATNFLSFSPGPSLKDCLISAAKSTSDRSPLFLLVGPNPEFTILLDYNKNFLILLSSSKL